LIGAVLCDKNRAREAKMPNEGLWPWSGEKTLSRWPVTAFSRTKWYPSTPGKIYISNTSRKEEQR
tara:strand:- start:207 stop:401 length:195 start_codon:yes stop_codon:yes gene_type:complete